MEELLEQSAIDVVSICTPPATHSTLIESAAAAGKHVLVEKPLALNLVEADRALAICEQHRVHLGVVHQQRARSATRALHEWVVGGVLGRPIMAVATHTWFKTPLQFERERWRGDIRAGGGMLLDQAIHAVDLLVWFLGVPRWVSGYSAVLASNTEAEDTAVATIGFEGGALATLAASTVANMSRDDIALDWIGTCGGFRVEIRDYDHAEIVRLNVATSAQQRARSLSLAEIEARVRDHDGLWRGGPSSPWWRMLAVIASKDRGAHAFRSPRSIIRRQVDRVAQAERGEPQGHAAVLARMAAASRGECEPLVTGHEARHSLAVIEGLNRSATSSGARVELRGPAIP